VTKILEFGQQIGIIQQTYCLFIELALIIAMNRTIILTLLLYSLSASTFSQNEFRLDSSDNDSLLLKLNLIKQNISTSVSFTWFQVDAIKAFYEQTPNCDSLLKVVIDNMAIVRHRHISSVQWCKEVYKELYENKECKYLAEKVYQIMEYFNSAATEFNSQSFSVYTEMKAYEERKAISDEYDESGLTVLSNGTDEFGKLNKRLKKLDDSYDVFSGLNKTILLGKCYNP